MKKTVIICGLLLTLAGMNLSTAAAQQDQLILGSAAAAPGTSAALPVRIVDVAGTPLGWEAGAGRKIQGFSIQLVCSPSASVQSISLTRAGLLLGLAPLYETERSNGAAGAFLASFDEAYQPLRQLNRPEGAEVAQVTVALSSKAAAGTVVNCDFVPTNTILSNQSGSQSESQNNGYLKLSGGAITVGTSTKKTFLSIAALGATAYEKPKTPGSFRITRVGKLRGKLIIPLVISGTARNGVDYTAIASAVTLRANQATATIVVKPIRDTIRERRGETVVLTLSPGTGYILSKAKSARVVIKDAP